MVCARARALALQMSPHLHTQHQRKTMATVRRLGPGAEVSPAFPSGPTMPRFAQYEIALDHTNTRHARHTRPRCCCLVLGDFGRCKRRNFTTTTTTPSGGVWNTSASTEDKENGPLLAQNSAQCAPLACGPVSFSRFFFSLLLQQSHVATLTARGDKIAHARPHHVCASNRGR